MPVGVLAGLAEPALAVHGQNDQLRLLRPAEQRALLDRFAGDAVGDAAGSGYAGCARRVAGGRRPSSPSAATARGGCAQEADLLRHGLDEIEAVDPQPGEDDELPPRSARLAHADDLRDGRRAARAALARRASDGPSALGALGLRRRGPRTDWRPRRRRRAGRARRPARRGRSRCSATSAAELAAYLDRLDADPARLAAVSERRAALTALTRKYADDVDGVLAWAEQAARGWPTLDASDEALAALARAARRAAPPSWPSSPAAVTAARTAAAARLAADRSPPSWPGWPCRTPGSRSRSRRARPRRRPPTRCASAGAAWSSAPDGVDEVELRLAAAPGRRRRSRCTRARPAASCPG